MQVILDSSGKRFFMLKKLLKVVGQDSIRGFQASQGLTQDGKFGIMSYNKLYNLLLNPEQVPFSEFPIGEVFPKKQIIIHHSAGWDNARGMFQDWQTDARRGVCTSVGIDDNGRLFRGFNEQFWGHALGVEQDVFRKRNLRMNNVTLNRQAVQVEICSFGALNSNGNGFTNWTGRLMPIEKVDIVSFRGFSAFERYTEKEIETLELWIVLNAMRFDIPLDYKGDIFWNVNDRALSGEPGVWGHCSFRPDKTDPYPQPKLVELLQKLSQYELPD